MPPMHYVYLIESVHDRAQHYVGQTDDLRARLHVHNSGGSIHTRRFKPWNLVYYLGFADENRAVAFERYLKTGSGKIFLRRYFL
jgi:putative endonuclease